MVHALAVIAALQALPAPVDTTFLRAESLFVAGNLVEARRLAERLEDRHPRDPRVLILLGRIHLAWPVIGRNLADTLFTRAARLEPDNPEAPWYVGQVGLRLGGADGGEIAHRGFLAALAIDPDYRDTWTSWHGLYRGDGQRQDAVAALERHAGRFWHADYWRGQLLVELRRYDEAATLLEDVVSRHPEDPGPRAWLARAQFLAGRDADGAASYRAALEHEAQDTGQVMWKQVRGAVTPAEREAYGGTLPEDRAAFLRLWWSRRDPVLSSAGNERMGEHFRRLADAQRYFALRHPESRYFHSETFRTMSGNVGGGGYPGGLEGADVKAAEVQCSARRRGVLDDISQLTTRPESVYRPLENLEDGLDDRGRIWLRHGRPDYRFVANLASETWCYYRDDGRSLRVSFVRRTGGYGGTGDMVLTALAHEEWEAAAELLVTDNTARHNTLSFAFWHASFRATDRRLSELVVIADSIQGVAVLLDDDGREVARDTASGRPLRLVAPPGAYALLMDAVRGPDTSRYRGTVTVPDFSGETAAISSILIASGNVDPSLDALLAWAPPGLILSDTRPLRVYAELYNLGHTDNIARYRAEYWFERTDGGFIGRREHGTTIGFDRERPFSPRLVESLIVDPDRLPPGRYRLHIEITDQVRAARAVSATIEFRLR